MREVTALKTVKCPVCGWRLMDKGDEVITEERTIYGAPVWYRPDFILKCKGCRQQIGVKCVPEGNIKMISPIRTAAMTDFCL